MIVTAKIEKLENGKLVLKPDVDISRFLAQKRPRRVEVRLDDGRTISADQRRKIFAIIRDISLWSGAGRTSALSGMGFLLPLPAGVVLPLELRYDHGPRVYYISDSVLLPLGGAHKGQPAHPDGRYWQVPVSLP